MSPKMINQKNVFFLPPFAAGGIFLLFSCIVMPAEGPSPELPALPILDETPYQIVKHRAGSLAEDASDWLDLYLTAGITGVQTLHRYEDSYVFISVNSGTNLASLNHWAAEFSLVQDFPQLVSLRVLARIIGDGGKSPDREYGPYFETIVKNSADAFYTGAVREDDFWILKRYDGGDESFREIYDFFILVSIDKDMFKAQMDQVLKDAAAGISLTREQADAVSRLLESFYDGF
jgi:hypothetical protein